MASFDQHLYGSMANLLYQGDLPSDLDLGTMVAVDSETMGLNPVRDRLCLVQLSCGDGNAHLVQFSKGRIDAPNLSALLRDPGVLKIFHYARFDLAAIRHWMGVIVEPVYCTKIASKLVRTFAERHGLKDICKELLDVDISKQMQSSDWGALELSNRQLNYAATDVLYLHRLKEEFDRRLEREDRKGLAEALFSFLPTRAELDLLGWDDPDILDH